MTRALKWTIGVLSGLVIAVPVSLDLWIRGVDQRAEVKMRSEATNLVSQFHQHFNAGDLDEICNHEFQCDGFEGARVNWPEFWKPSLQELRSRCGNFRSVASSSIRVSFEPASVRVRNISSFEKGQLHEDFDIRYYERALRIAWYEPAAQTRELPSETKCW